jgi:UDP-2,3-diacylglucosamine pyrophosphatase LpxH
VFDIRAKQIQKAYSNALRLGFNNNSKLVFLSDVHRGIDDNADNFSQNQHIYFNALQKYYDNGYTLFELGDGDELWKNKRISDIKEVYVNIFWMLGKFYAHNRYYMIYGNHDMEKRKQAWAAQNLQTFYDDRLNRDFPLFPDITPREAIVLQNEDTGREIFLLHGHQADLLNCELWRFARFLVRYLWRPLESLGIKDPTSSSKNKQKKEAVEKELMDFVQNKMIMIAGHTHRANFPDVCGSNDKQPLYFNDGSCVHPRCITAIEIVEGRISLVKWQVGTKPDGAMYICKKLLEGPCPIEDYFK